MPKLAINQYKLQKFNESFYVYGNYLLELKIIFWHKLGVKAHCDGQ
jgi:hypothetical protein